jgi:RNA polymerase sigma-70 factor, ECF subfamily
MQSLNNQSEDTLFQLFRGGNNRAFDALFELLRELLYHHALNILKDEEEAKDVVQDVFVWLWKHRAQEINIGIRAYLRGAVRQQCADRIRRKENRRQNHLQFIKHVPISTTELPLERKELGQRLAAAISMVNPADRNAFLKLYTEGKSLKEISSELGINVQSVKNNIHRALKLLRKNLKRN